ncbi:AsmA family protein [Aureimonas mangrovi]|uniref:AsmA family protein n=1 Tax=Aureimonas mangrovi TaxID=2758041 RepID=UPI00163D4488|nr:AsmA family protein [Aureimonas mangrovi]
MRFFIAIGGLVVLLLTAVLVAPYFVNWTAFRDDFEREASRVLGQPVRVAGDAEARLLPFPSLTFNDVIVGEGSREPVMTLARFSMDAELAPLLSGETRIFQMRIEAPHLRLSVDESGQATSLPGLANLSGTSVVLENVEIADGRISLQNSATGRSREITGLDARLTAQSLAGPFSGGGEMRAQGEPLSFSLSSGRIEQDGRFPVRLTLGSHRLGVDFTMDGATVLSDPQGGFDGRFTLASRTGADPQAQALLPQLRLTGGLAMSRRDARFTEIRAEVGAPERPYVLSGEGTLNISDIPHFDMTLRGEQVDVDRLAAETGEAPEASVGFSERAEAVRATLAAVPRIDIPGRLDLTLPIVTAGDTAIRNLRLRGSPSSEGWSVSSFSAELPGRALVEASGILRFRESLAFSGDLLLAAREPSRFAVWLTGEAPPAFAGLGRAGFSARVDLSAERQRFEGLEVDVGGQMLTGELERAGAPGARTVSADIVGGAADLDAFLAFAGLFASESEVIEPVTVMDVRFEAGPVSYGGLSAGTLAADFSFRDDLLDLREMNASDFAGADIGMRGTVAGLTTAPVPDLALDVSSQAPGPFLRLLSERLPGANLSRTLAERAATLSPLSLSGTVAPREGGTVALAAAGTAGTTRVDLTGEVANGFADDASGPHDLDVSLSSEAPMDLLAQFGFSGLDLGLPDELAITFALDRTSGGAAQARLAAEAGESRFTADGDAMLDGSALTGLDLALAAQSEDAAPWMTAAGLAFGQGLDALPVDLTGRLAWNTESWSLADLAGSAAGIELGGRLQASAGAPVAGAIELGELSLPWLVSLVAGVSPDLPSPDSAWPAEAFGGSLLSERGFALDVSAARLDLGRDALLHNFTGRLESSRDRLAIADASAELGDSGRLGGSLSLSNLAGFGTLAADLTLEGTRLPDDALVPLRGTLGGRLTVEGSGRSFAEIAGSLTGAGEARLADGALEGIAPGRFAGLLVGADAEGFEPEAEAVQALATSSDVGASYPLPAVTTPLTVSLGVVRAAPVSAANGDETLTTSAAFDFSDLSAEGSATLAFIPSEDETIPDTAPAISYVYQGDAAEGWRIAGIEPLTGYLSLRAYAREQERLEMVREELRETLRLRREARLYRDRAAERERIEVERIAAEEAERARLEAEEAERERQEAERQAAAERAAQAAANAPIPTPQPSTPTQPAQPSQPPPASTPPLDFELTPLPGLPSAPSNEGFEGLPGVTPLPSLPAPG